MRFRYRRSDFGPLPVTLDALELFLDFRDGDVRVTNTLRMTARESLSRIVLDARDLRIEEAAWIEGGRATACDYAYASPALNIALPGPVAAGASFCIRTRTVCTPGDHVLEGIYRDVTPEGCPQQYVSQCQQWGFQRIAPVFDDCTARCRMRTTIEADARYTHLISNGNVCPETNPSGAPEPVPERPGRQRVTYENAFPIPVYLFVVCVGTWEVLADEIAYPSGRRVRLEYLVPPGRLEGAREPMAILKDAMQWHHRTQGYEYRYDVYRTICMERSNYGGMENVGNTTIITDAALIDAFTGDRRLVYAHGVILHEFAHNQCGSDVTMRTPFDMWLNEAFTVDIERRYVHTRFDPDVRRLAEVDQMRDPLAGPLAVEDGGHMGRIVREGFNHPSEVVDGVTYVKAAEVLASLRLLIGEAAFRRACDLYFSRYHASNADTDQFLACFTEASGRDLSAFRREWLHTIGYPCVEGRWHYDAPTRSLRVVLRQRRRGRGGDFHVPVRLAAVGDDGRDIPGTDVVAELRETQAERVFRDVPRPAFVSFNRDASFYGAFHDASATPETLALQVRLDPNRFNRVEAMRRLTDVQRVRLIRDPHAQVDDAWLGLYGAVVAERDLPPGLKAFLLHVDEQTLDRQYLPAYRERWRARARLRETVSDRFRDALRDAFASVDTCRRTPRLAEGVDARSLKAVLLQTIAAADTPETQALAERHFRRAWHLTDKASALACVHAGSHPGRRELLETARAAWCGHLSGYLAYLAVLGTAPREEVFDLVEAEQRRAPFRLDHPGHARALLLPLAQNNRLLWTPRGMDWVRRTVLRLGPVNEMTAVRLLGCLAQVGSLAADLKPMVLEALEGVRRELDAERCPSLAGRAEAYLEGAGAANA